MDATYPRRTDGRIGLERDGEGYEDVAPVEEGNQGHDEPSGFH